MFYRSIKAVLFIFVFSLDTCFHSALAQAPGEGIAQLELPCFVRRLELSADRRYVVVIGGQSFKNLQLPQHPEIAVLVDVKAWSIRATVALPSFVSACQVTEDSVYLAETIPPRLRRFDLDLVEQGHRFLPAPLTRFYVSASGNLFAQAGGLDLSKYLNFTNDFVLDAKTLDFKGLLSPANRQREFPQYDPKIAYASGLAIQRDTGHALYQTSLGVLQTTNREAPLQSAPNVNWNLQLFDGKLLDSNRKEIAKFEGASSFGSERACIYVIVGKPEGAVLELRDLKGNVVQSVELTLERGGISSGFKQSRTIVEMGEKVLLGSEQFLFSIPVKAGHTWEHPLDLRLVSGSETPITGKAEYIVEANGGAGGYRYSLTDKSPGVSLDESTGLLKVDVGAYLKESFGKKKGAEKDWPVALNRIETILANQNQRVLWPEKKSQLRQYYQHSSKTIAATDCLFDIPLTISAKDSENNSVNLTVCLVGVVSEKQLLAAKKQFEKK